jgi:hypothetical protein
MLSSFSIWTMSTNWKKVYKHIHCVCMPSSGLIMATFPVLWICQNLCCQSFLSVRYHSLTLPGGKEGLRGPHLILLAFGHLLSLSNPFPQQFRKDKGQLHRNCTWSWWLEEAADGLNIVLTFFFCFETESPCVTQADLELTILLPPPTECWNSTHVPPCLALEVLQNSIKRSSIPKYSCPSSQNA